MGKMEDIAKLADAEVMTNIEGLERKEKLEDTELSENNMSVALQCPVEVTVNLVGGKWKLVILYQLATHGSRRFNELRRALPAVTQRTLTRQLRELESDGLINRQVYAEVPPKVEYSLTDTGRSLHPLLLQLQDWGLAYMGKNPQSNSSISTSE